MGRIGLNYDEEIHQILRRLKKEEAFKQKTRMPWERFFALKSLSPDDYQKFLENEFKAPHEENGDEEDDVGGTEND